MADTNYTLANTMKTHFAGLGAACALLAGFSTHARADSTNLLPSADTTLQEAFPDNNFGGGSTFTSGGREQGGITRALLQFDIAGQLPPGATINSVTLTVTVTAARGPDSTFDLHRLTASWGEGSGSDMRGSTGGAGEATWNVRLGPGTPWATAGGDFAATASASQAGTSSGSFTFSGASLAADVQDWLNNPAANFGWMLRSETESTLGTIRRFAGRLDPSDPPQLVIDYTTSAATATPELTVLDPTNGNFRFSFNTESNHGYVVEYVGVLPASNWDTLRVLDPAPTSSSAVIEDPFTSSNRFYRVRTE